MRCTLLLVITCIMFVSKAQSQLSLPLNVGNPTDYVKEFADRMKKTDLHARRLLLGLEDKQTMINALERKAHLVSTGTSASKCDISVQIFAADLRQGRTYAVRMVDSWGKLESGILTGNIIWMGRYHECTNAQGAQLSGKYFYLRFGKDAVAGYGMCLPDSCTTEDAEQIKYLLPSLLNIDVKAYHPVQPTNYTAADIISIIVVSLLGCLVICGTFYELHLSYKAPEDEDRVKFVDNSEENFKKPSVFSDVILSFSFIKNTRMIFDTTQKKGSINVLHGLRFFSMAWVILGHTFSFSFYLLDNAIDLSYYYLTNWSFQAVGNATYSVDSFFFLSGLLAAYLGLKEMKKRSGKLNIPLMYAYRYLRLTPAYAFCILILTGVFSKFGGGPVWPITADGVRKNCLTYWWTNLLYINNLYPASLGDECFGWGWYLANDMQFFLLLPFLLYIMYKRPIAGATVLSVMGVLSMIATGVLTAHYELQPLAVFNALFLYPVVEATMFSKEDYQISPSDYSNTTDTVISTTPVLPPSYPTEFWADTYAKPWCRLDVYFIGVMTGLILYSTDTRIRMNKKVATVGWITATATALAIIYGLFGTIKDGQPLPVNVSAFYEAVSRSMWAFCLMWLVIACTSGYGGPVNALLSWKAFIPLSRLTFCAYLIHPLVLYYLFGNMETQFHFSLTMLSFLFLGVLVVSLCSAFLISILIETPMVGITKAMFGKSQRKRPSPTVQLPEQSKL